MQGGVHRVDDKVVPEGIHATWKLILVGPDGGGNWADGRKKR